MSFLLSIVKIGCCFPMDNLVGGWFIQGISEAAFEVFKCLLYGLIRQLSVKIPLRADQRRDKPSYLKIIQ